MQYIVTTSYKSSKEELAQSKRLAEELECQSIERNKRSLSDIRAYYQVDAVWVVTKQELKLHVGDYPALFFHPSIALLRIKRLLQGEQESLIHYSGIKQGDHVLDCTAGMGADSIVLSYAVGEKGQIVALESELAQYVILREGVSRYRSEIKELNVALRRIQVKHAEHYDYLQQLPSKSVDVIYFDPMFRRPLHESPALAPLRNIANHQPLRLEAIAEARRVARKSIVMKEHRNSAEFQRLNFKSVYSAQSGIAYGVIEI